MWPEISYIFFKEPIEEQELISIISKLNGFICVLNPDSLLSEIQIFAAYSHLQRNNDIAKRVNDSSLRLMIHISGEKQIRKAMEMVGFRDGMKKAVVVYEDRSVFESFLSELIIAEKSDHSFIPHDARELDRVVFPRIAMSDFQS